MIFFRRKLLGVSRHTTGGFLITFRLTPTWFGRLLFCRPYDQQYVGDCTVWFNVNLKCRPWTFTEAWLADILTDHKLRGAIDAQAPHY